MRKRPALIACLAVLAVAIAGGAAFYMISANEERQKEQAVEEKQQEVLDDLQYAYSYNFICYTNSGEHFALSLHSSLLKDPTRYTRVDFYDERPAGFDPEEVEDGAVVAFPSGLTKRGLAVLNDAIGEDGIDASAFGLGQEVTMYDMAHRRAEVQALVDGLDTSVQTKIYNSRVEIMPDLDYVSKLNFALYARSGELDGPYLAAKVRDDPPAADYFRVDYYDALPEGFDPGSIEDGVIVAVPTEKTQKGLDRFNDILKQYDIDPTSAGFGPEITMYNVVHDPRFLLLLDKIPGITPKEEAALEDSVYNPE